VYAIERAMAKGRDDRWPDAAAFRDALAEDTPVPSTAALPRRAANLEPAMRDYPASTGTDRDARPAYPQAPTLPPGWMLDPNTRAYGREALQRYKDETRRWKQRYGRDAVVAAKLTRRELKRIGREGLLGPQTPEERVRRAQRALTQSVVMVTGLAAINAITSPGRWWFLFPAVFIAIGVVARTSRLWISGIPLHRLFQRQPESPAPPPAFDHPRIAEYAAPSAAEAPELAAIPRDVLDGPQGRVIRDAVNTKATIAEVLAKLSPADRQMLPEIQPTVDSLVERVCSLAQGLHQLDADASPDAIAALERRIAEAKAAPQDSPDLERRLQLLERQQATLHDLAARRSTVAEQLERASLVLQTMKLDLFKLRSSGLDAKLDATTGATQEARALSTDIGRVLEAANEVRKL
jgi:serine/threonine-protein kinase